MKSNKKRILFVLAILTMAILLSFVFVACDKAGTNKTGTDIVADYKVTIHPNNGQGDIVWDITKAIPTITKDGFHIAGYFLDAQLTISTTLESLKATELTKNIDVYVKWEEHVEATDAAVEPTCTEKGLTEGKHCSKCGKILTAQTEIDALGHKYGDLISKIEPTCSATGTEAHYKCSVCNKVFKDDEHKTETTLDDLTIAINPDAHNFGEWIKNEGADMHTRVCSFNNEHTETENCLGGTATCTEQAVCEKCNEKYGSALGHKYGDLIPKTEPTCSATGTEAHYKCSVCNKVFKDDEHKTETTLDDLTIAINPDAHNFGDWIKNEGADTHTRICSFNNEHSETENCLGGTATCTEQATCEKCNEKYGEFAKHKYKDNVCVVCGAVRTSEGLEYYLNSDGAGYTVDGLGTCTDKEIIIPSEYHAKPVTSIGSHAFRDCTGLTSVTIPDSVTSIVDYAFYNCSGLTSVTIGNGVTSIGWSAFEGCTGLTSVTIPDSVTSIGHSAFSGCSSLTTVTIGNSVTIICDYAFSGCTRLTSITIPDSVTSIDRYAFQNCTGLTSVTIGNGVTKIGNWAFYGCTGFTSVTIPNSVTDIVSAAFEGCTGLTIVNWNATECTSAGLYSNPIFKGCSNIATVNIGANVKIIPSYAFYNCTGLTSITIPNSVTNIGGSAIYGCDNLQDIYITDIAAWCNISGLNYLMEYGASNKKLYINNELATSITFPNGVTEIPSYAFRGCSSLTSITIPDGVKNIGESALQGCAGLTTVNWNATACTTAGSSEYPIFENCSKLTTINLGDNVTTIPAYAFYGCSGLTSITIPNSVASIGQNAFSGCTGLTSISGSATNVSTVAKQAVSTSFTVNITSGTSIDNSAFQNCTGLTSVTIGNGVTSIGNLAFYNCSSLTSVTIPNSVTSIGLEAFKRCSGLTNITIPDSVTSIGDHAFADCTGLTSITIGSGVTSIGESAFQFCSGLTSIAFNGTTAQWKAISKGIYWKYSVPATQVICTDGTVSISEM